MKQAEETRPQARFISSNGSVVKCHWGTVIVLSELHSWLGSSVSPPTAQATILVVANHGRQGAAADGAELPVGASPAVAGVRSPRCKAS